MTTGMVKVRRKKLIELAQMILFLAFLGLSVALNLNCSEEDDNPAASLECGSGHVTWNDKAQVCVDLADNKVLPSKCCGR